MPSSLAVPGMAAGSASAVPLATAKVAASSTVAPAADATSAATGGDPLTLRAVQATWVQAVDGSGQTLMARLVPAGETVSLTAKPPLRLRIGNAGGTELSFRGQPIDLKAVARDNIANITLP
jgi:cytoskeleton protein RodZ